MSLAFTSIIFLSAGLLFFIQPLVTKILLPKLGGSPAVWNTTVFFFQTLLLGGYCYAHQLQKRFSLRNQFLIHSGFMALSMLALPLFLRGISHGRQPWEENPILWMVQTLFLWLGIPFFLLSTTSPLLQSWLARTSNDDRGPYYLYAASNFGSLLALVGYPLLFEPFLTVPQQKWGWTAGFIVLAALIWGLVFFQMRKKVEVSSAKVSELSNSNQPIPVLKKLQWTMLAALTTSLLLGTTQYLTTDVACIPLLWVVPLALFLITYVIAFLPHHASWTAWIGKLFPALTIAAVFTILAEFREPVMLLLGLHLAYLFCACFVAHSRLADTKPHPSQLTLFYFCLALGGFLGGFFNSIIAPSFFKALLEYPVAIILLTVFFGPASRAKNREIVLAAFLVILATIGLNYVGKIFISPGASGLSAAFLIGLPLLIAFILTRSGVGFATNLFLVFLCTQIYLAQSENVLLKHRDFFGVLKVSIDADGKFKRLVHGNTIHGLQNMDNTKPKESLAYFHALGPFGVAYRSWIPAHTNAQIAAVGLGVGSIFTFAQPGQTWRFYEINPAVIEISTNPKYFNLLEPRAGVDLGFVVGDARLRLIEAPDHSLDLMVLDAFSSDSPPLHLITREAFALYFQKMKPNGVLLFHISHRSLNFSPVLAVLAAENGAKALSFDDRVQIAEIGKLPSHWMLISRDPAMVQHPAPGWVDLKPEPGRRPWTDDYTHLLGIFHHK